MKKDSEDANRDSASVRGEDRSPKGEDHRPAPVEIVQNSNAEAYKSGVLKCQHDKPAPPQERIFYKQATVTFETKPDEWICTEHEYLGKPPCPGCPSPALICTHLFTQTGTRNEGKITTICLDCGVNLPSPPPRSFPQQALDALAAKDAEIARLKGIIERAPHGHHCDWNFLDDGVPDSHLPCDCWKSEAR
jgi:hypothetical protein